ncbi:MAG TPA: hypothetical protein VL984_04890, partial [Acidimicrobiales bacterium]|nr:hypothetical protein [Acidimicrobiales bacterium]
MPAHIEIGSASGGPVAAIDRRSGSLVRSVMGTGIGSCWERHVPPGRSTSWCLPDHVASTGRDLSLRGAPRSWSLKDSVGPGRR